MLGSIFLFNGVGKIQGNILLMSVCSIRSICLCLCHWRNFKRWNKINVSSFDVNSPVPT